MATVLPKNKITVQEYHCHKAVEEESKATFLDKDENGEELDYEDFELHYNPANNQISYQTPTPAPQEIPDLLALQDTTVPKTTPDTVTHHAMAAANRAPGFGIGSPSARASPMQVGTPVASPQKTLLHGTTAEEMLLQGVTLPCFPWQETMLLSPPPPLTDTHIKMMDTLCYLDTTGLQFICESVEALRRERTPVQAPPGYCMPQVTDSQGTATNSPLSQEFLQAASNLGTTITRPQQLLPQQHHMGNCHPDAEIEDAITNMQRHEQASWTPPTSRNQ